jgi:hypothetical protein
MWKGLFVRAGRGNHKTRVWRVGRATFATPATLAFSCLGSRSSGSSAGGSFNLHFFGI